MSASDQAAINTAWPNARLGDIADVRLGKMLDKTKHRSGALLPYLRNINVRWGAVDTDDVLEMFFKESEHERYSLRAGDVLVCEGGEPGRAAVWDGRLPNAKYQKALHRVRFQIPYESRLFVYLLELLAKTGRLERRFTGSTIKHFTRESLVELPVPVPPLEEQRRIVEEIEQQLSRLDAGVDALKRAQAGLKRYRAAALKAACEGRLVPTEAELARKEGRSYEPASALLARIKEEKAKQAATKAAAAGRRSTHRRDVVATFPPDLPPLPDGWSWVKLGDIAAIKGGVTKSQERKPSSRMRLVPYLRVANVQRGFLDLSEVTQIAATAEEIAELALSPGDVLFNEGGDRDKLGRGWVWQGELPECIHQNHVFRARLLGLGLQPKLVSWYGNTAGQAYFVAKGKQTTNLASINLTKLSALPIPVPPSAEQERIVAEVERRLSLTDDLDRILTANLHRATRLRQSILSSAFSGDRGRTPDTPPERGVELGRADQDHSPTPLAK